MRVSLELIRHLGHPRIVSQILFVLGIFSLRNVHAQQNCSFSRMLQISWILQFFEAHSKVYHAISQYLNLLNHNHGFQRQAWQIRNSRFQSLLPSCATRECHLQFLVCDDDSRSRIFLYHDMSKSIWSAIDHSVMVLAPGTSTIKPLPIFKIGSIFWVCIDRREWSWILLTSGRCAFFAHWRASPPSAILKKSRNIRVFYLDRMVEFCRCLKRFNFAHEGHRFEIFQVLKYLVSRSRR